MCHLGSWRAAIWGFHFLYDPTSNGLQSCQSFITSLHNVRWWEEKAITPTVLELKCEGVFDAKVIDPVIRSTRSQVWRTKQYLFIMNILKYMYVYVCKYLHTYILSLLQHHTCMCFCNIFLFSEQLLAPCRALKMCIHPWTTKALWKSERLMSVMDLVLSETLTNSLWFSASSEVQE